MPVAPQRQKRDRDAHDVRRERLRIMAEETLDAIEQGRYVLDGTEHDLSAGVALSRKNVKYYSPDSLLSGWSTMRPPGRTTPAEISVLEVSTLEGARLLSAQRSDPARRVGILNFASATKPGGGFKNGAQAQEESIARASTLYPTLVTPLAQTFYALHLAGGRGGYYTHAMVYSPGVTLFRDDAGRWAVPLDVDVLTSAAVNAGVVRQRLPARLVGADDGGAVEERIAGVMRERMARVLCLFEVQGVRDVVLGSFGTGVFRNDVGLVAGIWADLLLGEGARFGASFERVVFAILGRPTFETFERVFAERRTGPVAAGRTSS